MKFTKKQCGKNSIKIVAFVVILLLMGTYFMSILSYKDTGGGSGLNRFHAEKKNVVDAIFFGSSHTHCTVDVGYLWDNYGIAAYNLTAGSQKIDGVYYFIKEALKTQKPKVIVVDLYSALGEDISTDEADFYRASGIKWSIDYLMMTKEMGDNMLKDSHWIKEAWLKFPLFHDRYGEVNKSDFVDNIPYMKGYRGSYDVCPFDRPDACDNYSVRKVGDSIEEYLDKINALAQKKDVELVFMVAPYILTDEEQEQYNWIEDYATNSNIRMINFNHKESGIDIDYTCDFRDTDHLNNIGAQKVTEGIISFIKREIVFDDHRGNKDYDSWNDNSRYLYNKKVKHDILTSSDINEYLTQFSTIMSNYDVIVSLCGNYDAIPDAFAMGFSSLGISNEDYHTGGTWVISHGEVMKRLSGDQYDSIIQKDQEVIYISATSNAEEAYVKCMINEKDYATKLQNGINVIIYDDSINMIVDCVTDNIYYGFEIERMDLE